MQATIQKAFTTARRRLLLLDYDGTLREFEKEPPLAVPTPAIRELLTRLGTLPGTEVVLISGRPQETMDAWFNGLPVGLVAEHGFYHKLPGGSWQQADATMDDSWKPAIRDLFKRYITRVPLSTLEEKQTAITWHYRAAAPELADRLAHEVRTTLAALTHEMPVVIVPGHQVLEVHTAGVDKGTGARQFLTDTTDGPWDFILAAGDDVTDEDLFRAMPPGSFTVKVGAGDTCAHIHVASPAAMRNLLESLAESVAGN